MGFWLATLNPGKKTRRGRRKRRTLTPWQRAVKRHGGVMQAVKARRVGKRKRKGGRRRRNPFLTTALTSGGAKVLMNATKRRRRKNRTRRSAVARRILRRRSRRASPLRRSKMARKTRRRRLSRGRSGRFVSRRSRGGTRRRRSSRRRVRRNPVLPISWNPKRKRRRGGRRRRNPLFLSRKGFSPRKHRGYRRLRMKRSAPRHWHNNPRRRRSYRRNSVLPISWNPARALGLGGAPGQILGKLRSFVDVQFLADTAVPAATGFFASKVVGSFILDGAAKVGIPIPAAAQPYAKMAADALGGATLAYLVSRFYKSKAGDMIWMGTIVNVAHALLKQVLGGTSIAKTIGLDGLGDDLADRMKRAIADRVAGRLNGMGAYLRSTNIQRGVGEYVTEGAMRMNSSYSPTGGDLRDYDVTNQENGF